MDEKEIIEPTEVKETKEDGVPNETPPIEQESNSSDINADAEMKKYIDEKIQYVIETYLSKPEESLEPDSESDEKNEDYNF